MFSLYSNDKDKGKAGVTGCYFVQWNEEKVGKDSPINNLLVLQACEPKFNPQNPRDGGEGKTDVVEKALGLISQPS